MAVPGALRGWEALLGRHGRLTLEETLGPAVRLAREGFRLCKTSGMWFQVAEEVLRLTDETRKNFYNGDRVYFEGEEMRFPELADTLEAIGEGGAELLYEGELGRRSRSTSSRWVGSSPSRTLPSTGPSSASRLVSLTSRVRSTPMVRPRRGTDARPDAKDSVRLRSGIPARGRIRQGHGGCYEARLARPRGRLRGWGGERDRSPEAHERGVRQGAAPAHLRLAADHAHLLRRRRRVRRLHHRHDGLRVRARRARHRHPAEQHSGEPELNPKGFHALEPGERLISSMSPTIVSSEEGGLISSARPGHPHPDRHPANARERARPRDVARDRGPRPALPRRGPLRLRGGCPHGRPRRLRAGAHL